MESAIPRFLALGEGSLPLPPRRLIAGVGGGDFRAQGEEFLGHFRILGGLRPGHCVLDIGCGCGRMALPLMQFLNESAHYDGFDISGPAVRWCQRQISGRNPRFRFVLADVYNGVYNRKGRHNAATYAFPYASGAFDFVFATSVFTHMLEGEVQNYLREVHRCLRPGGRALLTFFLINEAARRQIREEKSTLAFPEHRGAAYLQNASKAEWAVGYDESAVGTMLRVAGLRLLSPARYGRWCGRIEALSYQDILVVERPAEEGE